MEAMAIAGHIDRNGEESLIEALAIADGVKKRRQSNCRRFFMTFSF
jgi:hypothetical protein